METWRKIENYDYEVSDLGRVRNRRGDIIKPIKTRNGYYALGLWHKCKVKRMLVHCLVFQAFIGQIPENKTIDHIDADKGNNSLKNLQLLTNRENVSKYYRAVAKSSRFIGVCKYGNRWISNIVINGVKKHLGYFKTQSEAGLAYQKAKIQYEVF